MNDPISDFFIRIVNAQAVSRKIVFIPFSKMKFSLASLLKTKGLIKDFVKRGKKGNKTIKIVLGYENGRSLISGFKRISKPGRRFYEPYSNLRKVKGGYSIVSTSRGLMTSEEAKKRKLGGELLVKIW